MSHANKYLLVLWALLAIVTFNPFGALLGTLSYKYIPDTKAVPDTSCRIRLSSSGTMTVLDGEMERSLAKGTRLEVLGTCQFSAATYSPREQMEGRLYLVQLPDSTRGYMTLPQMEGQSFFRDQSRMLVYLLPGGKRSATDTIRQNEAWLEAHGNSPGFITKVRCVLRKINRVPLRIFKAVSSKYAEGGHYFLFPRFQAWNVYDLPAFTRSSVFRNIWDFLCSVLFFMSAHLLARGLTRKGNEYSVAYYPLAVLITLLGITSFVAWFFFFLGLFVRRSASNYSASVRCPQCHKATMETYRRESIQKNTNLVEETSRWKEGSEHKVSKGYRYHKHLDFYDYDRCTHCGYILPRHKAFDQDSTEYLDNMNKDQAIDEFNRTDGTLTVHWDNTNQS